MFKKALFKLAVLFIFSLIIITPEEKTVQVFTEYNDTTYALYEIKVEDLNTNNFLNYFNEEIKVLKIYPHINKIYKKNLKKLYSYTFNDNNYQKNIKRFTNYYIENIKNYYNEEENYLINGIDIDKVIAYTNYNYIINNYDLNKTKFKKID